MSTLFRFAPVVCLLSGIVFAEGPRLGIREVFREGFEGDLPAWKVPGEVVDDAQQAHGGNKCVRAEATGPNQALRLTRVLLLEPSRIYNLSLWTKSANRCRLAVWASKGKERFMIAIVKAVARGWQAHKFSFNPPTAGDWTLEIIMPSSHGGAPAGEMFVDDVRLTETVLPKSTVLTGEHDYAQYPAIAASPSGSTYVAWQTFEGGKDGKDSRDGLWVGTLNPDTGDGGSVSTKWEVDLPGEGYVFRPVLTANQAGTLMAASVEVDGQWDVYAWPVGGAGVGKRIDVATTEANELDPAIASGGSSVWLAWVSNQNGKRVVYAAQLTDGKLGTATAISAPDSSSYTPAIAAAPDGRVWVAWSCFRDDNYDLWMAQHDGSRWQEAQRLTDTPEIEHRPVVAHAGGDLWVAWESGVYGANFRSNAFGNKRVFVARMGARGLETPQNVAAGIAPWIEKPALAADASGGVWLTVRRARERQGWESVVYRVGSKEPGVALCAETGRARRVDMATTDKQLLVAVQTDNYGQSFPDAEASKVARSEVRLVTLPLDAMSPADVTKLVPLAPPDSEIDIAADRRSFGEDLPPRTIEYNGQTLHLYYGDFHDHSDISQCNRRGDLVPDDNYAHNRDLHRLDFSAVTDHGYNITPALWHLTGEHARANTDEGRFLAFLGEEWTSTFEEKTAENPNGFYGHRNLVFADPYFPKWFNARDRSTPQDLWDELAERKADFIQIPHQLADNGNVPTDWDFTDEVAQPVAEIWQTRGSYEYRGAPGMAARVIPRPEKEDRFLQDAWARKIVIGVIASPDHGGGRGKAAVYAPSLEREAILDAMRQRHTFGTSGARIFIDFRVNGRLMGEKLKDTGDKVTIEAHVIAPQEIQSVDLCRSNEFIYSKPGDGTECTFTYVDQQPLDDWSYYYLRVIQKDEQLAWSSPVWFGLD